MSVGGVGALVNNLVNNASIQNGVSISMLKKAQDSQAEMALQLLQTIPSTPNLPAHLGQNINVVA